ncbi:MAG: FixH family protein [Marinoscillum sp.]
MKWNWGKGIVLAFSLFCGFVVTIVVLAFQEDFDLVSETYYQDELNFQDQIDSRRNLTEIGESVKLTQTSEQVVLSFPETFNTAQGEVNFYHPSRSIFDKKYTLNLDETRQQSVAKSDLVKGRYKVQFNWLSDGVSYYQESEIFLR